MEPIFGQLVSLLTEFWWPFVRVMAILATAPVLGEALIPMTVRALLALVLAVVLMPLAPAPAVDPFSAAAVVLTLEQIVIGGVLGIALHLSLCVLLMVGSVLSSQSGLGMAMMNDPVNGTSSDVLSAALNVVGILVFFAVDGHLLIVQVLASSFQALPISSGIWNLSFAGMAHNVSWVFAAATLLALPVVFAAMVVQIAFGFLNRVAPTMNLYALGFSVVTLFSIFMLSQLVRTVPEHYIRMTHRVLEMIHNGLKVTHGG